MTCQHYYTSWDTNFKILQPHNQGLQTASSGGKFCRQFSSWRMSDVFFQFVCLSVLQKLKLKYFLQFKRAYLAGNFEDWGTVELFFMSASLSCFVLCLSISVPLSLCMELIFTFYMTRRYGPLRGPTSSSCRGLRPRLFLHFGQKKSLLCCFGPFLAICGVQ